MANSVYSLVQVNGLDRVNVTTAQSQTLSDYVQFANGGGLVVYTSNSSAVMVRLLDAGGEPTGAELTLDATEAEGGEATLLSNGNVVITWADGYNIRAAIYSQGLQQIAAPFTVFAGTSVNDYRNPEIAATPDGGFVISGIYAYSSTDDDINTKKYDAAGNAGATAFASPSSLDDGQAVAVAPNGNVLVAFAHYNPSTSDYELWTELYNPTLQTTIKQQSAAWVDDASNIEVVAKADNSFEIVYSAPSTGFEHQSILPVSASGVAGSPQGYFAPYNASKPAVGYSPSGQLLILTPYLLSSSSVGNDIRALLFDPDRTLASFNAVALPGGQSNAQFGFVNAYTLQLIFTANTASPGTDGSENGVVTGRYLIVNTTTGESTPELLTGSAVIDVMNGGGGDDTMDGAGGPDTMRGGAGNDTYYVRHSSDVVDEQIAGSSGYDTVRSSITYTLPNNIEALVLLDVAVLGASGSSLNISQLAVAPLAATGNSLNNFLQGNNGDNRLDGSYGADLMKGLGGNDTYVVDNQGDVVNEIDPGSSGWDAVYSSVDYKLGANLEGLVLLGTLKLDGTGNGLGNYIQGNGAANVLRGGGGNDTIRSLGGRDTIDGGNGSDTADYSEKLKPVSVRLDGSDSATVRIKGKAEDSIKNIENLIGGSKADSFTGDSRANSFDGRLGIDIFTGRGGNDRFVFSTALTPINADKITDFSHDHDKAVLEDTLFAAIGPTLQKGEFYGKAGATKAHDANDRIIHNESTGKLYYDADGKGGVAAVHFATLTNSPNSLDHGDFVIV